MPLLPRSYSRRSLLVVVVLLGCFVAQFLGAQLPSVPLLAAGAGLGLALDLGLTRWRPRIPALLARLHCDETVRQLLRDLLIVAALVQLPDLTRGERLLLVGGLLAGYAVHLAWRGLAVLVRRSRTLPLLTRNIDTSGLGLSPAPPWPLRQPGHALQLCAVPATVGTLATVATERALWGLLGVAATLTLLVAGAGYLATWLLVPSRRAPSERRALEWFDRWLADYRPDVGLYFSGGPSTAYQANMWLSTLARLDGNTLIVLRERDLVQRIGATDVPLVCLPRAAHLARLEQSTLTVLLHPANAPKTSQVVRIPTIKHAFTNHGESDKLSSCNPYAKVYDEVWVAGPAARQRYADADVGVADEDVVEVGRPQLAPIRAVTGPPAADRPLTVLYAPTWEGWGDATVSTSLILAGEALVRTLLETEGVRVLYRPHPMTGTVDRRAGAADARVRALLAGAGAGSRPRGGREGAAARAELERRTAELSALSATALRRTADDMERMLRQGAPQPGRAAALETATEAWHDAFWAAQRPDGHLVLTGPLPSLYSCFNEADVLISDVSSVVADFLASQKPYAVVNTSGLPRDEFVAAHPTVRAATVLAPDAAGLPELLAAVRDPAGDALAEERARLKEHLLGPEEPPSTERFAAAVAALRTTAEARRRRLRAAAEGPAGRECLDADDGLVDDQPEEPLPEAAAGPVAEPASPEAAAAAALRNTPGGAPR